MDRNTTDTNANVEPHSADAPNAAQDAAAFNTRVCLTFHHRRKRLVDPDGLSVKAVIDGLVAAKILADDSPKQIAEIRHIQTQGEPEETEIIIEEVFAQSSDSPCNPQ